MYFAQSGPAHDGKLTKVAIVAVLHGVLGYGLIHSINHHHLTLPKVVETVMVTIAPDVPPPPPPPEPPKPKVEVAPPEKVFVPPIPAEVTPPPTPPVIADTTTTQPPPSPPGPTSNTTQSDPNASNGVMRSAVYAEGCSVPEYPTRAARMGESGTVNLALLINADGHVGSAKVVNSSGSRDLDKAAVQAVSMCKFKPAMNNGVAEAGWAKLSYVWKLEG